MATQLTDEFVGSLALLTAHTSDSGHTYFCPGPAPYAVINGSGSMAGNGNTGNNENAWHVSNAAAVLPISTITAPFTASSGTWNMGVIAFGSADGQNGYMFFVANGACAILKKVAGVYTTLPGATVVTTTGSHTLEGVVSAGSQVLKVDGVTKITATDTSLDGTAGKFFGVYRDGSSTTPLMASVTGSDSAPALVAGTGSVVSVTGSSVTVTTTAPTGGGTPYTYQLYRSTASGTKGSAVSGATSFPYTDTGRSQGTQYWYTWDYTDAAATTVSGTQFSATTSTGISLTRPTTYEAFQRSRATNTGTILLTVVNNDSASHSIEASFNGGAYVTVATNLAAGATANVTLPNQPQGNGTLTVRFVDTPATLATATNVMIGEIIGIGGQSNAGGAGTINQSFQSGINSAGVARGLRKLNTAYVWQSIAGDPINGDTGTGGSIWPLVATTLAANLDCDIAFVEYALGGVGLAVNTNSGQTQTWVPLPSNRQDLTTPYGNLVYKLKKGNLTSDSLVVWWVGESDCAGGRTQAQQTADFQTVGAGILADVGGKSMFIRLQDCQALTNENNQRNAILATEAALPNAVAPGPTLEKYRTDDGTYHITTTAGLSAAATVVGLSMLQYYGATGLPPATDIKAGTLAGVPNGTRAVGSYVGSGGGGSGSASQDSPLALSTVS